MRYLHRFNVNAPIARVAEFHRRPEALRAITPPPVRVELHRYPSKETGGAMDFTLWFGPLPIHWSAFLQDVSPTGFTDIQLSGPFAKWEHRHTFVALDERTTQVVDQIELQVKPQLPARLVGICFILSLPALFAYRGWKTQRLLAEAKA